MVFVIIYLLVIIFDIILEAKAWRFDVVTE